MRDGTINILLASAGWFHPPLMGRLWLRRALDQLPAIRYRRISSLEALPKLRLDSFQGIVLYYHYNTKTISLGALTALDGFVRSGGGVLAIHAATASYMQADAYFEILGGKFIDHGPVEPFLVSPSASRDDVFGDIPAFMVRDELYLHKFVADIRVHYYAEHEGEQAPMVWTRNHGSGRVCYACPGHRAQTMRTLQYQEILRRGLVWACGERSG